MVLQYSAILPSGPNPKPLISEISRAVTERLKKTLDRRVIVPDDKIENVLDQIVDRNKTHGIGNSYSMQFKTDQNSLSEIIADTVDFIASDVESNLQVEHQTAQWSKWNTIRGVDTSKGSLQAHPQIKLNTIKTHNKTMGYMRY